MPARIVLHVEGAETVSFPSLEGLSDQTPGVWMPWEHDSESRPSVFGVQRDIASLEALADTFSDLLPVLSEPNHARNDEDLVEWYFNDESVMVDLTVVLSIYGRDMIMLGRRGKVVLEGT